MEVIRTGSRSSPSFEILGSAVTNGIHFINTNVCFYHVKFHSRNVGFKITDGPAEVADLLDKVKRLELDGFKNAMLFTNPANSIGFEWILLH